MIGIPWKTKGRDRHGIDCVGLALLVQKELYGRDYEFPYDYNPLTDDESILINWIESIADRVDKAQDGDLVIYRMPCNGEDKYHIGTVVDGALLHIYPNKTSRMTRLYKQRIYGIFRGWEVEKCQEQ